MTMLLDRANKIPPFICRILARKSKGWEPVSHNDIAKLSKLPRSTVADLSRKTSWDSVPFSVACQFSAACGVDLGRPARHLRELRITGIKHITRGNAHQRLFFQRLIAAAKAN